LKPVVVGVCGGTGSGKTTVSRAILDRVGMERIAYIQHDSYYRDLGHLPIEERARINFDHPIPWRMSSSSPPAAALRRPAGRCPRL